MQTSYPAHHKAVSVVHCKPPMLPIILTWHVVVTVVKHSSLQRPAPFLPPFPDGRSDAWPLQLRWFLPPSPPSCCCPICQHHAHCACPQFFLDGSLSWSQFLDLLQMLECNFVYNCHIRPRLTHWATITQRMTHFDHLLSILWPSAMCCTEHRSLIPLPGSFPFFVCVCVCVLWCQTAYKYFSLEQSVLLSSHFVSRICSSQL